MSRSVKCSMLVSRKAVPLRGFARTLLLSLAVLCAGHAARADEFLGGPGGSRFNPLRCPLGTAVVGLAGRAGDVIDTIQLFCGKGRGDPDLDTITQGRIGPSQGGGPISAKCPIFHAATSIDVRTREFNGNIVISQILLHCRATLDGSQEVVRFFGGGGGDDAGSHECNPNTYINGFAGRSGTFIDAIAIFRCVKRSSLN